MQLTNEFTVPVPVQQAWTAMLDVAGIAPCLPGAVVDSFDGETVTGHVQVRLGPISVTYRGTARFVERDGAAHRAVVEASGRESKGSGTAAATITTSLSAGPEGTRVHVLTDLKITGKPAQFGRGVLAEVSAGLIASFASCLAEQLQQQPVPGPDYPPEPAPAPPIDLLAATRAPLLRRAVPVLAAAVVASVLLLGWRRARH